MIGSTIYKILQSSGAVQALLGFEESGTIKVRVSPMKIQQLQVLPAVFYQVLDNDPNDSKYGSSRLDEKRVQLTCYSDTYKESENVMYAVRLALDRYSGTVNDQKIQSIQFLTERDAYSESGEVSGIQMDFKIRVAR